MKNNNIQREDRVSNLLFCIGFSLVVISRLLERSALMNVSDVFLTTMTIVAVGFFFAKIILSSHERREFIFGTLVVIVAMITKIMAGNLTFLVVTCLAFISMRGVNIRTVLKIDIAIKTLFLTVHGLVFMADYMSGVEGVSEFIFSSAKGIGSSLYFVNPNTTGMIGLCIVLDMLYLKANKKVKDFMIPTLIMLIIFLITVSRAPLLVYIVYLLLQFIKNARALTVLQRTAYPLLFILCLVVVVFVTPNTPIYNLFDGLLSGRVRTSFVAFNLVGVNILPSASNATLLKDYTIDVFYIKCLVEFGVVTMLLYYLPHIILPPKASNESKRMSIVISVYLLFETVVANIGFATPYLILADCIYNGNDDRRTKWYSESNQASEHQSKMADGDIRK